MSPDLEKAANTNRTQQEARDALTRRRRAYEPARLKDGQRITYGEFSGTVARLYADGPSEGARMYEVRLPGGTACVCGSDLIPAEG